MARTRQRRPIQLLAIVLAVGSSGALAGCGDTDGESAHYPGTVVYNSPDGAFHFHYLSPPWLPVRLPGMMTPIFLVPPTEISGVLTEADAPYTLHVDPIGAPAAQAISDSARALSPPVAAERMHDVVVPGGKAAGREMSWQESAMVFHREAYLSAAQTGSSFRMRFTARRDIADDPLIGQMITSFEPRSSTVAPDGVAAPAQ